MLKKSLKHIRFFKILLSIIILPLAFQKTFAQKQKYNILFILADDLGAHDLSFTGSNFHETPNIDKIAEQSMVFTNGYAACQVCSPSRASIMTGKFPARHGITDWIGAKSGTAWREKKRFNKLLPAQYSHALNSEYTTLPEALKEQNYKTFFAGKWHLGNKGSWPEDHGFDINKGGYHSGGPKGGYFAPFKNPNLLDKEKGENLSMRLAKETVDFITDNKDTNFFAFLSFYAVHGPIQTTEQKWEKYRNKAEKMGIAQSGFKMGHFLPIRQIQDNPVYAGLVESMDDAVGNVMKTLKKIGLDKNTIVIFTSDNGGVAAGDNFSTSNKPLRAGKGYQFEGGIREPYFISVPDMNLGGKENHTPVSGTDFYPTILDLIGAKPKPNEHSDGVSLLPLLQGKKIAKRSLIWHYPHYGNQGGEPSSIIREGKWKMIHYYEDGREELYNLDKDLSEKNNLSAKKPTKVQKMSNKLFAYLKSVNANFPEKDPKYDKEKEEKHLENVRTKKLKQLEKQRLNYLSKDFNPKNNWWGSKPTVD